MFTVADLKKELRDGAYAWPGGYPKYFIQSGGDAISFDAVKANFRTIIEAMTTERDRSGWAVVGVDCNWEDPELYCSVTNKRIESAYAEPDQTADINQ